MANKLRILQLSPRFPFPADDGGKIGIANILIQFAEQGADVTFFSFYEKELDEEHLNTLKKYAKPVLIKHSIKNTPFRMLKSFFKSEPLFIFKYSNRKILRILKKTVLENKFDVIHCDHSSMAPLGFYAKSLIGKPVGLRLHNIEWMIWQLYADVLPAGSLKRWSVQRQANLLKKAEQNIYSKADVCFAITEPDRIRALELAPSANVIVASAGVNPDEWNPDKSIKKNRNELILATTYNWIHNVDALRWFIEKVLSKVKATIPDIKLTLLGKDAPDWLNNLKNKGVNLLGYVPEVQSHLNSANIYISPLFVGSGIRIKILEAMAMELPVVASPVAAEGINARDDNGLFICVDENSFAQTIIYLCFDEQKSRKAGEEARKFVIDNFSWKKNVRKMIQEYIRITNPE